MAYSSLAEMRSARGNFDNLMKEVEKLTTGGDRKDDNRFWTPTVDKAQNGSAIIRFLPPVQGEDVPWVRTWNHGFQGPTGKWYIENSLTTLGQTDPVSELNSELWNSGIESNKDIARKQKRRLTYIANILVIKDPAVPANEGKVFLYKFGKKIFDKIKDLMQPQFEGEDPINPFDFDTGANFKLLIQQVEGYRNYDKSKFDNSTPIAKTDEAIEAIWKQEHSLQEFLAPSNFKSYEDLKKRLDFVLKGPAGARTAEAAAKIADDAVAPAPSVGRTAAPSMPKSSGADEQADDISYFAGLAND
jgi:hypothetical protein